MRSWPAGAGDAPTGGCDVAVSAAGRPDLPLCHVGVISTDCSPGAFQAGAVGAGGAAGGAGCGFATTGGGTTSRTGGATGGSAARGACTSEAFGIPAASVAVSKTRDGGAGLAPRRDSHHASRPAPIR